MKLDIPALLAPHSHTGVGVDIRSLTRSFAHQQTQRQVLNDLDLNIAPGEFLAIVGRSGCGKSTLLRLLAGLDTANRGSIALDGKNQSGISPDLRIMFQDARLLPWKTIIDNVALGLRGAPAEIRSRALEALDQVGLADRASEWPARLSGGQRQRVALARALIHRPRLLLLDEPLGALDALTRMEMQSLIEQVWRQHAFTAVLVTHDVGEAIALADRVVLIEHGRITLDEQIALARPRERGTPQFAAYEHRVLKRLTSVGAINARNQQRGRIVEILHGDVISEVRVETALGIVTAAVSSRDLHDQTIAIGAEVLTVFKSTEVMLAIPAI